MSNKNIIQMFEYDIPEPLVNVGTKVT